MELKYILMIAGMVIVTYLPRYLPLAVLTRLEIPEIVIRWLKFIPAAILSALLAPTILMADGQLMLSYHNVFLLASVPTFLIAIYKKSIFLTVITGMIIVIVLQKIMV